MSQIQVNISGSRKLFNFSSITLTITVFIFDWQINFKYKAFYEKTWNEFKAKQFKLNNYFQTQIETNKELELYECSGLFPHFLQGCSCVKIYIPPKESGGKLVLIHYKFNSDKVNQIFVFILEILYIFLFSILLNIYFFLNHYI